MDAHNNLALIIRRLSPQFVYIERNKMLYGLGAKTVHNHPFYSVAFFSNVKTCQMVIRLLHQRMIHDKRIKVEYYNHQATDIALNAHNQLDAALKSQIRKDQSNANIDLESLQDELWHFPEATKSCVLRIARHLFLDVSFYRRVLRLMIKHRLPPPFDADNPCDNPQAFFNLKPNAHQSESDDSEIETQFEPTANHFVPDLIANKKIKLCTGIIGEKAKDLKAKTSKKRPAAPLEEVFETCQTNHKKQININLAPLNSIPSSHSAETCGNFGLIHIDPETEPARKETQDDNKQSILAQIDLDNLVNRTELEENRMSDSERRDCSVFRNYHPGNPSQRLYVKNLHRKVTGLDLYRIFLSFIDHSVPDHLNSFDIVLMERGKMRGQAFVTYPSIEIATTALQCTNGYILHSKPMVVMFARNAN